MAFFGGELVTVELLVVFFVGLAVGSLVGFAVASVVRSRRSQTELLETTGRLSAAEAEARLEEERRQELESELDEVRVELARVDRESAVAQEKAEQAEALIDELKDFRERSRKELEDNFKALAAEALAGSSKQFLNLAEQTIRHQRGTIQGGARRAQERRSRRFSNPCRSP